MVEIRRKSGKMTHFGLFWYISATEEFQRTQPKPMKTRAELDAVAATWLREDASASFSQLLRRILESYEDYKEELRKQDAAQLEECYVYYTICLGLLQKIHGFTPQKKESHDMYVQLKRQVEEDGDIKWIKDRLFKPLSPFDFKADGKIDSKQLELLMRKYPSMILIIDVRASHEFNAAHLNFDNVINIEPVSIRPNYVDKNIEESSLITGTSFEQEQFRKRDMFELVILYDTHGDSPEVLLLQKILNTKSFQKPLRREALILKSGIESFPFTTKSNQLKPYNTSIHEYLSNPVKHDLTYKPIPNLTANPITLRPQSQPQLQTKPSPPQSLSPINHRLQSPPTVLTAPSLSAPSTPPLIPIPKPQPLSRPSSFNGMHPIRRVSSFSSPDSLNFRTGLVNLGNSCYMNCIIQSLVATKPLIQIFLDGSYKAHVNVNAKLGTKGILARYFHELAQQYSNNDGKVISPKKFKLMIGSINKNFNNALQQDCTEFLNFIIDGLHEDLNDNGCQPHIRPLTDEEELIRESMPLRLSSTIEWERYLKNNFSVITNFFQGQHASQLRCIECERTSTTFQSFNMLSLPVVHTELDELIKDFTKMEVLNKDEQWHCPNCKRRTKSTKKITITRLPQFLIIHLKRFDNNSTKIMKQINYPITLDLTKYWPQPKSKTELDELSKLPLRNQIPPFNYELYSVVNHWGNSLTSGHYTCYLNKNKSWLEFDDTKINKINEKKVVNCKNAYVLFYRRL